MSETRRGRELEIDEDPKFQRLDWKLQRVGWIIMGAIAVAALLGLFGRGPLSKAVEGSSNDPLRVEYGRFVRRHADEQMMLVLAPTALDANRNARVVLDSGLVRGINIRRITPQPESEEPTAAGVVTTFRFDSAAPPAVHRIRIDYQANSYWSLRGAVALGEHAPLRIHSIVFP